MIPAIIAAVVLIADQLTKAWVLRTWPEPYTGEITLIPGWLAFTYVQNTGVAFGLFSGMPHVFTVTSILIVILALYFYLKHVPAGQHWMAVSLGLIVGGAIGNVIDRIRFGYVVDFIKTIDGRFPVFNIADSCIVIGVGLMAIGMTYFEQQQARALHPRVEGDDGR
jgi:signal peptidase II